MATTSSRISTSSFFRTSHKRNCLVHAAQQIDPAAIGDWASNYLCEYKVATATLSTTSSPHIKWRPPVRDRFKVNTDAAVNSRTSQVGLGVVVRDWKGCVLAARACPISGLYDPIITEAMAISYCLDLALEMGFRCLCVESDSAALVTIINSNCMPLIELGSIISAIRGKMAMIPGTEVTFTPRAQNLVAHSIAHHALNLNNMVVWVEEIPSFCANYVNADLANILNE